MVHVISLIVGFLVRWLINGDKLGKNINHK